MHTIDSTFREIKAHYGVRFYRSDIQGVADSMMFNTRDSVLSMYREPVVWNNEYQLYGDTILVFMNDTAIDHARIYPFAMAAQQLDSTYYDQLKGQEMIAYFEGQAIKQVYVSGNAESIFYPIDEGGMIGMNHAQSSYLMIWLKDGQLERLKMWPEVNGTMTPVPDLQPSDKLLEDFFWFDYMRPRNKHDIYIPVPRKAGEAPKRSNKFVH
jgi:hypothetical protein